MPSSHSLLFRGGRGIRFLAHPSLLQSNSKPIAANFSISELRSFPGTETPLIRIIGDRSPWQVKSAILSTLTVIIRKGGISLKPFIPQLQTTFVKCLQDSTRTVCSSAVVPLGKLSALSMRVDPLVGDLLPSLQASNTGIREAMLTALRGVMKHAGKNVSRTITIRVCSVLKDLIHHDDDQVRVAAASILGIISQQRQE